MNDENIEYDHVELFMQTNFDKYSGIFQTHRFFSWKNYAVWWDIISCTQLIIPCTWHIISCAQLTISCTRHIISCAGHNFNINTCQYQELRLNMEFIYHLLESERLKFEMQYIFIYWVQPLFWVTTSSHTKAHRKFWYFQMLSISDIFKRNHPFIFKDHFWPYDF